MKPGDLVVHQLDKEQGFNVPGLVIEVSTTSGCFAEPHALIRWTGANLYRGWHQIKKLEVISEASVEE